MKGEGKMTQEEMKLALLGSTIRVIARNGLDKTTTRAIATEANLNEAYIYRLFDCKGLGALRLGTRISYVCCGGRHRKSDRSHFSRFRC